MGFKITNRKCNNCQTQNVYAYYDKNGKLIGYKCRSCGNSKSKYEIQQQEMKKGFY